MVARMAGKGLVPYPPLCCGLWLLFDLEVCAVDEAIVITAEVHEVDNDVFVAVVTLEGVTLIVLLDELFSVGAVCEGYAGHGLHFNVPLGRGYGFGVVYRVGADEGLLVCAAFGNVYVQGCR